MCDDNYFEDEDVEVDVDAAVLPQQSHPQCICVVRIEEASLLPLLHLRSPLVQGCAVKHSYRVIADEVDLEPPGMKSAKHVGREPICVHKDLAPRHLGGSAEGIACLCQTIAALSHSYRGE